MRNVSILVMSVLLAVSASAQAPRTKFDRDEYRSQMMKRMQVQRRAYELRPQRRDEPLRYLNISDDEVREIQLVAERYLPKNLLNISPVVSGCPCEEGPQCTDQVYIVAETARSSKALQMSRVKNAWVVGTVQQWWLKREALNEEFKKVGWEKYEEKIDELFREFPACVGELVPVENKTASVPKAETKK